MSWTLLYKNDPNGKVIDGNLSALEKAVAKGCALRVFTEEETAWDLPVAVLTSGHVVGQTQPFQPLVSWTDLTQGSVGSATTRTFSTNGQWREQAQAGTMQMAWYADV